MTELTIIVAMSQNNIIGSKNKIPWKIPEDIQRFKKLTTKHPVIMGRKTYESIPSKFRPLSERLNIVLSRTENYSPRGAYIAKSFQEALNIIENNESTNINCDTTYIAGGESLYKELLKLTTRIELTLVHKEIKGDTKFPILDKQKWKETAREDKKEYSFITYIRK